MAEVVDAAPFAYDAIQYPSGVNALQTPDRIRAAGLLHGWRGPDPATASILEIGCGDGYNLMGIAAVSPQARCVGFDLSRTAIARGRDVLTLSGLANVELAVGDIATYPLAGERYDYIVCHGVYTWIPDVVRQPLLDLVGARLKPGGVAYISFDALPAAAPKAAINRFLVKHVGDIVGLEARVDAAVRLLAMLARNQHSQSRLKVQLDQLMNDLPHYMQGYFVHDWLAEHYAPITLADFRAAAGRAGLRCAGDGSLFDLFTGDLDDEAEALLAQAGDDPAERSNIMEILRGAHQFRRELLVRVDAPPPATPVGLDELSFGYMGERIESQDDKGEAMIAYTDGAAHVVASTPLARAVMDELLAVSPNELTLAELAERIGGDRVMLADEVRRLAIRTLVTAHGTPQTFTTHPGERPRTTGLVRAMMSLGPDTITLRHSKLALEHTADQEVTQTFLTLCDGSRNRADIARALTAQSGQEITPQKVDAAVTRFAAARLFEA